VSTVSALPAAPGRVTRFARALGLDRNPLRPSTDRALTWIRLGLIVAFLAGGPLAAIGAGRAMYLAGVAEARAQAVHSHSAQAVLLAPTPAPPPVTMAMARGEEVLAQARWQGTGAAPHTGEVLAAWGSPAGTVVTVWVNASGKLTPPPLQPAQISDRTWAVGALASGAVGLCLLAALWIAHRLAVRRRLAAWDAAWSAVGPQWTRGRP
jgi:hypothetical protein